jgi:hypothetical protein
VLVGDFYFQHKNKIQHLKGEHMKERKTYSLIIGCLSLMVAVFPLPASSLAQSEPCSVEINATCNGSTDCSGILSGWTDIKNTGTEAITCQVVVTSMFGDVGGAVGKEIALLPQEQNNEGLWVIEPIGGIPFWDFRPITKSGTSKADCYVTDNPEIKCTAYEVWECSATCDITPVSVDIKLKGNTSSVSLKDKGLLPVVLMGADDFDATAVDPATIRLGREGIMYMRNMVAPLRWNYKKSDLCLKFDKSEVVNNLMLEDVAGQKVQLVITGNLKYEFGKMPFMGAVSVLVSE